MKQFYSRRLKSRRQERFDIPRLPESMCFEVLDHLKQVFHGKGGYCETPLAGSDGSDRFRPKTGAVGLQPEYWPGHCWWLADDWRNLYAACGFCNKMEGGKFPVTGDRAKVETPWTELELEQRLPVDPRLDVPSDDFAFCENGLVRPHSLY